MAAFLLEVGTEELPARFVASAIAQWQEIIPATIAEQLLAPATVSVYGTPRRLALLIEALPERQPDREEAVKGPPAQAAFKDGAPTKAAAGFAKKQGVAVADLEVRLTDKGDFVFVQKQIPGRPAAEIILELLPGWINALEGKRFMRWGSGDLRFSRPIRWLVTLLDEEVLPFSLDTGDGVIQSDRVSQGHRVLHPQPITLDSAAAYVSDLKAASIYVDPSERRQMIQAHIEAAAASVQGVAEVPSDLLEEVVDLVEMPSAVVGQFDPDFLVLPAAVIKTVMVTHQRYFPVLKSDSSQDLLPYFITISNGDPSKADIIAAGNGRVVRARLADGQYFYQADCAQPLDAYLSQLEQVTFQEDLGSVRAKVGRLGQIAHQISTQLHLSAAEQQWVERASLLCKADLVTQMVYEFPELQGFMGQTYAQVRGEPEAVAQAIFEHYLPRGADDALPQSLMGQIVGIADRVDTLVSIFALGLVPTGSSDPFALRRAANAIINIIWHASLDLNLAHLLEHATTAFVAQHAFANPFSALQDFFLQRVQTLLQDEQGLDYDLVNAVLGEQDAELGQRTLQNLVDAQVRAQFLQQIRSTGTLSSIYETVNRAARLAKQGDLATNALDPQAVIQVDLFQSPAETAFLQALTQLLPDTQQAQSDRDYQRLVDGLVAIAPTVSQFFDGPDSVMVMTEDIAVRQNRLNLLGLLRNHARVLGDFGAIVKG